MYGDKEDRRGRYADVLGVDMLEGPGVDRVLDLEEELPRDLGQFDHIECMSVLEHSRRPWLLAANLERLMRSGASIFVSVPFVWRLHGFPSDYWRMTPEAVRSLFPAVHWVALEFSGGDKIPRVHRGDMYYLRRTETLGFGRR